MWDMCGQINDTGDDANITLFPGNESEMAVFEAISVDRVGLKGWSGMREYNSKARDEMCQSNDTICAKFCFFQHQA